MFLDCYSVVRLNFTSNLVEYAVVTLEMGHVHGLDSMP